MAGETQLTAHAPRLLSWGGPAAEHAEHGSQIRTMGLVLRDRWRLIATFAGLGLLVMAVVTLLMERQYTATAVVHVENEAPHVTKMEQVATAPSYLESLDYFQDQVSLLKSRTLMAAVIRELRLQDDPHFKPTPPGLFARMAGIVPALVTSLGGTAPPPQNARGAGDDGVPSGTITRYAANLDVKPVPNSRLIQVKVTARDPDLAQAIANAHANEYIRRTLQAKFELTGEARKYLEQELDRIRKDVDEKEAALDRFRREHDIVAADDAQNNAVVDRLQDLTRRLTNAQAQRIEFEAQHQLVQSRDFESIPAVLQNGLIQTLKAEMSRLESREAELSRIFLDGNPELQQVRAQVGQTGARLRKEIERTVAGVESQYLAAKGTEDALRAELQRQESTVLDLKEISGQYVKLDQAVQAGRHLHQALLERMGETEVVRGVQLSNITVVDPAERPSMPSRPNAMLNVLFGLVLGVVLGVATAAVLENVDTSLKTPADVERVLSLPTLGVIPDFRRVGANDRRLSDGRSGGVLAASGGTSVAAEVFRTLRTSILFFDPEHPPKTMLVTSSQAGEGKTATVVNLALSLAQQGARVLLIDADLRRPRCHHALGLPEGAGLSEYLQGELDLEDVVRAIPLPGAPVNHGRHDAHRPAAHLDLIASGAIVQQTAELLSSARMRAALAAAAARYDIVLVDSPPVFPVADASLLATMVDGVVLVVRGERTPRHLTREAIARLRFMQAKILGVVLNAVNPAAREYSYRYSYYFREAALG